MVGCEKLRLANRLFLRGFTVADEERGQKLEEVNRALESRLVDLERRLMAEREKVLAAEAQSKGEQAATANVENALKDMQDKLRRDKREQELEAGRQAAEAKARDLERRLAEERDMWVTMLKERMAQGGDTKPLLQEIAALKAELAQRDERLSSFKDQAAKGGGDQKMLQKEISSLNELLARQQSVTAAREDEIKLLRRGLAAKDADLLRQNEELTLRMTSFQQALTEKEVEVDELRRQMDAVHQEVAQARQGGTAPAADVERDRIVFLKRLQEQKKFQDMLNSRVQELEKEVGKRDAMIQAVRAENEELQKKMTEMTAAKDAETRLMRENLQRLGRQNKELLTKLQSAAESVPGPALRAPEPGSVSVELQGMMSSLEDALLNRDRMLEDQQKSLTEKKGLIEGLFGDLKSLDDQAVALLEEKTRQTDQMNEKIASLFAENDRLRRTLESRDASAGPPPAPPPPS